MISSGFFITLFDKETLRLYLNKGIYGFHMAPVFGEVSTRSNHYAALADYACARKDSHVFFFLKREIIYGGQIIGSEKTGAFFLNGKLSPLGRSAKAPLCWDESDRACYSKTKQEGIFTRPDINKNEVCQPYIFLFKDKLGLAGRVISSDQLYFNIGKYPFPLPTNSISGMSFCPMTPFETNTALDLIKNEFISKYEFRLYDEISFKEKPTIYHPKYEKECVPKYVSESYLEALILANPFSLEEELRPGIDTTICRQVPISPFKPFQMDRTDICYYRESFFEGAIPYLIIELKRDKVGKKECEQVERYLKWLQKCVPQEWRNIRIYILAPGMKSTAHISYEFRKHIHFRKM